METIIKSSATPFTIAKEKKAKSDFWEKAEFNRFGIIAFVLAIVACTSGIIAAFFVDGNNQLELTMVVTPTMFTLCMILAVAPIRVIIGAGVFALIIDMLMMIF